MASARSDTASLAKIDEMWLATVFGEMHSSAAMAALRRPAAMRSRTSRSLAVRPGKAAVPLADGGAEKWPRTRVATPGPKISSPRATARMARSISPCAAPFST